MSNFQPGQKKRSYNEMNSHHPQDNNEVETERKKRKQSEPQKMIPASTTVKAQTEAGVRPSLGAGGFKTTKLNFKQLALLKQQNKGQSETTKENQMQSSDWGLQKEQKISTIAETQMDLGESQIPVSVKNFGSRAGVSMIEELDRAQRLKAEKFKQKEAEAKAEAMYKVFGGSLPQDWSLKTQVDIQLSCGEESTEGEKLLNDYESLASLLKFYVFAPGETPPVFLLDNTNKEYQQHASAITWVKSFKDVYFKFLRAAKGPDTEGSMSCFYLLHPAFAAVFRLEKIQNCDQQKKVVVDLVPSAGLKKDIKDKGVKHTSTKIYEEAKEEKEIDYRKQTETVQQSTKEAVEEDLELEALLDNCVEGALNLETDEVRNTVTANSMHHNTLNLKIKDAELLYQFDQPNTVHAIYNILTNYVLRSDKQKSAKATAQTRIIAPAPFINCFYKECSLLYKGTVNFMAKEILQQRFDLKFSGIVFPHTLQNVCKELVRKMRNSTEETKQQGIQHLNVHLKQAENDKSRNFSHKKNIQEVSIRTTPAQEYRIKFAGQ